MKDIKIIDVTLRDGGCVNNFEFGQSYMKKILKAQEEAAVNIIELGYIDSTSGSLFGRTQYINEQIIPRCILEDKKKDITYLAMIDYGKYNIHKLQSRTAYGIDGIRIAFHKEDYLNVVPLCKEIMNKGYQLYIQPMVTLRYLEDELLCFIDLVNRELSDATGFYIVDSFGEMQQEDVSRLVSLVDCNLNPTIAVGLHCHNNQQLAYSNAIEFLKWKTTREILLDSSIMGMGKGAGNLNTELILKYINQHYEKNYRIEPLLMVIDEVINPLHEEFQWGYAIEYYLSAIYHCSPSYANYFRKKYALSVELMKELLSVLSEKEKISFNMQYAEKVYEQYIRKGK